MPPLFTSRTEWKTLRPAGRSTYVRSALRHVLHASLLAIAVLVIFCGWSDPYWRSVPVLLVFAASTLGGLLLAWLLFTREWHAAARAYGD